MEARRIAASFAILNHCGVAILDASPKLNPATTPGLCVLDNKGYINALSLEDTK